MTRTSTRGRLVCMVMQILPEPTPLTPPPPLHPAGMVLHEIACRDLPYREEFRAAEERGERGIGKNFLHDIAYGKLRPRLHAFKRSGVGRTSIGGESLSRARRRSEAIDLLPHFMALLRIREGAR